MSIGVKQVAFALAALIACAGHANAQDRGVVPSKPASQPAKPAATLKVGDPAPALSVDSWVKGKPVPSLESGKVYAVEFWATWCGPCIQNIPHLNQIQKDRPELTVIAVAASESRPAKGQQDRRLPTLQNFVRGKGQGMNYRVAFDSEGIMSRTWMAPAGQQGIPCAFVIDGDSKIAWIGHPGTDAFEKAIDTAIAAAKAKEPNKKLETPVKTQPKAPVKKAPVTKPNPAAPKSPTAPSKEADPK